MSSHSNKYADLKLIEFKEFRWLTNVCANDDNSEATALRCLTVPTKNPLVSAQKGIMASVPRFRVLVGNPRVSKEVIRELNDTIPFILTYNWNVIISFKNILIQHYATT